MIYYQIISEVLAASFSLTKKITTKLNLDAGAAEIVATGQNVGTALFRQMWHSVPKKSFKCQQTVKTSRSVTRRQLVVPVENKNKRNSQGTPRS
jgi:hypothetical protein